MSEPKITLEEIVTRMDAQPTTSEYDLALLDFLDLSDAEQKRILFRGLVQQGACIDWLLERKK